MFRRLASSLDFIGRAMVAESSTRQIAGGIAIGILAGMLPKGNFVFAACLGSLFALRVNLAAGLITTLVLSLLGPTFDPLFHAIGYRVLTWSPLQPFLGWLFELPFLAWTGLNNSVVVGALLIGLLQLFPTRRLVESYLQRRWSPVPGALGSPSSGRSLVA